MLRELASKIPRRAAQYIAAGIAIMAAIVTGASTVWVFRPGDRKTNASFWRQLFSDRATLGFVRAAVVMFAIYTIGSLAALLAGGRWIRSIGKSGLEVDPTDNAQEKIDELVIRLRNTE